MFLSLYFALVENAGLSASREFSENTAAKGLFETVAISQIKVVPLYQTNDYQDWNRRSTIVF